MLVIVIRVGIIVLVIGVLVVFLSLEMIYQALNRALDASALGPREEGKSSNQKYYHHRDRVKCRGCQGSERGYRILREGVKVVDRPSPHDHYDQDSKNAQAHPSPCPSRLHRLVREIMNPTKIRKTIRTRTGASGCNALTVFWRRWEQRQGPVCP